ncbi:MAG TPA: isochorismatase family protein [Gemmatimonas sp.]|nr:isochorismatase family protein [Gemmatimonas sp.]
MHNINTLTIQNTAFAFIDHQPFVAFPVRSISPDELTNNVVGLAKVARVLNIPTVLTTISAKGGPLSDPLFTQLQQVFSDVDPIDRRNTNAWSDPAFVAAVEATGRRNLVLCGLWTEVCLLQTVLSTLAAGYAIWFVSDASGGVSVEAHLDAKQRMIQAGARPATWQAIMAELCPDSTSEEYQRLYPVVAEHGGGVAYAVQYAIAQMQHRAGTGVLA